MDASLIFKKDNAAKVDNALTLLRKACCNQEIGFMLGDVVQHIINAEMKLFNLREIIFFRYGSGCQPDDEARKSTEFSIQRCEDRLRAALNTLEEASWCLKLSKKGEQHLRNVDKAIAEASSYEEFVNKLNELDNYQP